MVEGENFDTVVERLRHNAWHYRERDPNNRSLSAFAEASLKALETLPFFQQNVTDMVTLRDDLNAPHLIKLLERCYQATLIKVDPTYPLGYDQLDTWLEAFDFIEQTDELAEMLSLRMLTQVVQSNIAERYKILKLIALAYTDRFKRPPSLLDVGTSEMHGPLKLVFDQDCKPFKSISVTPAVEADVLRRVRHGEQIQTTDPRLTSLVNKALGQCIEFGSVRGIDITNVDDPFIKDWVKSCSFYPDELRDSAKVAEYDKIETLDARHARVKFSQTDFSNTADVRKLRQNTNDEKYDIISFLTVFYQSDQREQLAMKVNASQMLNDGGLIFIQDAKNGNFEQPYNYTASLIDSSEPELGEQEIARWKTPRCKELMIGLGKLSVQGKLYTLDEALEIRLAD